MILSEQTLEILKNFSIINDNLFIEKDTNVLRTLTDSKSIFAEVQVQETFPVEIGILNLSKLLQTISLFNEPNIEFHDTHMIISEIKGKNNFKYYYTDKTCLKYPKGSVKEFPTAVSFDLNGDTLDQITKASRVTSLPDVNITYCNNVVKLQLKDRKNPSSNEFTYEMEAEGDEPLDVYMKVDNLKMIYGDYKMLVGDRATRARNVSQELSTLEYCIAMDLINV